MIREIRKKMVLLGNRVPFSQKTKEYIDYLERVDWVEMNLRLSGSSLGRQQVEGILDGEMVMSASVEEHMRASRLNELRNEIYRLDERRVSVSERLIMHFALLVSGNEISAYRKSTPVLPELSYTPIMPYEIAEMMKKLVLFISDESELVNPFEKAAEIHNRMMMIMPFRDFNREIAIALLEYYLVSKGFPMAYLEISEQEYNRRLCDYHAAATAIKGNVSAFGETAFYCDLAEAVMKRLELMIQLTDY